MQRWQRCTVQRRARLVRGATCSCGVRRRGRRARRGAACDAGGRRRARCGVRRRGRRAAARCDVRVRGATAACEVRCATAEVAECEVRGAQCDVRGAACGVRGAKCGRRGAACGVRAWHGARTARRRRTSTPAVALHRTFSRTEHGAPHLHVAPFRCRLLREPGLVTGWFCAERAVSGASVGTSSFTSACTEG